MLMSLVLLPLPNPREKKKKSLKYEVEGKTTLMPPPAGAVNQSISSQVVSGASLLCLRPSSFHINNASVFYLEGL